MLIPGVDVGLRHDVGDDAIGSALELGARLQYLSAGGRLVLSPGPRGRGLSLAVTPTWGASGPAGRTVPVGQFHSSEERSGAGSLNAEIGYAIASGRGRGTLRPYVRAGWASSGNRTMQIGTRWRLGDRTSFGVAARNDGSPDETDSFAVIAKAQIRW